MMDCMKIFASIAGLAALSLFGAPMSCGAQDAPGTINTIAGKGGLGFSGDGGPATGATSSWGFNGHLGIAVDDRMAMEVPQPERS